MRTERESALLALELCDAAEDLFERFQNYAPNQYAWAAKMIRECNDQKQRQLARFDKGTPK